MALRKALSRSLTSVASVEAGPRPMSEIPGPWSWPIVGGLLDFKKRARGFEGPQSKQLREANLSYYKEFGGIYRINMAGTEHVRLFA